MSDEAWCRAKVSLNNELIKLLFFAYPFLY